MSDNIPIDILDAANSAYMMQLEMAEEAVTAGEHKNMMVIEIAKAIYAERLRCAEIAGEYDGPSCGIPSAIMSRSNGR